jgi:hypothetical protein
MAIPMIMGKYQLCSHGHIGNTFEMKKRIAHNQTNTYMGVLIIFQIHNIQTSPSTKHLQFCNEKKRQH